jgi:hypothetical protein
MKSDLIDIVGFQQAETDKAILFSETDEKKKGVWLPKSQIEIYRDKHEAYFVTVTLPEWLAKDKGLI